MREDAEQTRLTGWAALIGYWTDFARAALALPADAEGERWRKAVPSIIALQAIVHAMEEVDDLEAPGERAVALDMAEIEVRRSGGALGELWSGEGLPELVDELMGDARSAVAAARARGAEWVVAEERGPFGHPGELGLMLASAGFEGDLFLPAPGVPLFPGCPCGFVRSSGGGVPGDEVLGAVAAFLEGGVEGPAVSVPRQAYRQFDFAAGGPVRDLVTSMEGDPMPGQPLLVPVVLGGEVQPVSLAIPGAARVERLPVVEE